MSNRFDASRDYYEALGIDLEATTDEIERAYRNRARKHHPDAGGSNEQMRLLNEARDILGNPETRRAYDLQRSEERAFAGPPDIARPQRFDNLERGGKDFVSSKLIADTTASMGCFLTGMYLLPARVLPLMLFGAGVVLAHRALRAAQGRTPPIEGLMIKQISGKYAGLVLALGFDLIVLLIMLIYAS